MSHSSHNYLEVRKEMHPSSLRHHEIVKPQQPSHITMGAHSASNLPGNSIPDEIAYDRTHDKDDTGRSSAHAGEPVGMELEPSRFEETPLKPTDAATKRSYTEKFVREQQDCFYEREEFHTDPHTATKRRILGALQQIFRMENGFFQQR